LTLKVAPKGKKGREKKNPFMIDEVKDSDDFARFLSIPLFSS
jgi:hypothetical protein